MDQKKILLVKNGVHLYTSTKEEGREEMRTGDVLMKIKEEYREVNTGAVKNVIPEHKEDHRVAFVLDTGSYQLSASAGGVNGLL